VNCRAQQRRPCRSKPATLKRRSKSSPGSASGRCWLLPPAPEVGRGAPKLRTELEAWRLGLACPAALLASRYGLATEARAAGVDAALGVKGTWSAARVAEVAADGKQALVFSDFPAALTALCETLTASGVSAAVLSSAITAKRRQAAIDAFTAGELSVLLVAATGQLGLNLQTAAAVVHLDVPTTAATLLQRSARAARIGSSHATVAVDVPVLTGCADEKLLTQVTGGQPLTDLWSLAEQLLGS
jgi:SNF2 family DNA or RNA helicase